MGRVNGDELKTLIEAGDYHPRPEQVAQAMLSHRAVRELLIAGESLGSDGAGSGPKSAGSLSSAGRIPPAPESPRQAA